MNDFNRLVSEQMITMEKLLSLHSELEHYQEMEVELRCLQNQVEIEKLENEIRRKKNEINEIQMVFEKQTEAVIQSYRKMEFTSCL